MDIRRDIHYVYGMKRGGQHCILYWIKSGYKEAVRVNNHKFGKKINAKKIGTALNVFINFEDADVKFGGMVGNEKKLRPKSRTFYLIIRDPFNLFASRLTKRSRFGVAGSLDSHRALWIAHAKWVLTADATKLNVINYNEWFASKQYRSDLSAKMGIMPNPYFLNHVPSPGHGSSFDGRKKRGSKMNVLGRWEELENEIFCKEYAQIFTEEVIDLARSVFGDSFVMPIIESERWKTLIKAG